MEKHLLSKSTFIRGLQCQKSLYLYKHFYKLRDPVSSQQQAIFDRGSHIGVLARKLFPGGVDVSPESPGKYLASVARTQEEIAKGTRVIYEAAFQFEQVLAAVDILVNQDGKWYAYEVKSSTRVSPTYLLDASLQYFVITNSGIPLEDFYIVHINNQYVKQGAVDVHGLFTMASVKAEAEANREMVFKKIIESKQTLLQKEVPETKIGEHCFSPYSCDFMGTCWKDVPEDSVFVIGGLNKVEQFGLYHSGVAHLRDVKVTVEMKSGTRIQVESYQKNEVFVEKEALRNFISTLHYPLYFMDFETFMPAVPVFDHTKPYQHIPFQYSLHKLEKPGGKLTHSDFLGEPHTDPRHDFIKKLLLDTLGKGDILVYNATFERTVLSSLKQEFPELGELIDERISRIKDLMTPFLQKMYYHPAMKGSNSIKNVLPALVPELKYDDMKIGNGTVAMAAFEALLNETDIYKIAETRDALTEYCRMDTLAMVKILEVLERAVKN
jgi:hypothetical protein